MTRSNLILSVCALAACAALSGLAGCSGNKSTSSSTGPAATTTAAAKTACVNKVCAVESEDPVNPSVTPVVWKGQNVGFCCEGCKNKFNQMSDAGKDAAVAKAVAMSAK